MPLSGEMDRLIAVVSHEASVFSFFSHRAFQSSVMAKYSTIIPHSMAYIRV